MPLAPSAGGLLGSLRILPIWGPAVGLSLARRCAEGLGCLRCPESFSVDLVTDTSGFPYRPPSNAVVSRCTAAVLCGYRHLSLHVGGCHAWVLCVCVHAPASWLGRAGRPPERLLVRLSSNPVAFVSAMILLVLATYAVSTSEEKTCGHRHDA